MKQAEKIDKIYYAVFGMNGTDGIVRRQELTDVKLEGLFKRWDEFMLTRTKTCPVNTEGTARKLKRMDIIKIVISLAGWATLMTKFLGLW